MDLNELKKSVVNQPSRLRSPDLRDDLSELIEKVRDLQNRIDYFAPPDPVAAARFQVVALDTTGFDIRTVPTDSLTEAYRIVKLQLATEDYIPVGAVKIQIRNRKGESIAEYRV